MNWKKWLGYSLYKKLWSLVGGRPWTYIYRDIWHRYEIVVQAQWFFLGVLSLYAAEHWLNLPWHVVCLIFWVIYTLGYINGHFFWGRRYIPGQMGDNKAISKRGGQIGCQVVNLVLRGQGKDQGKRPPP